MGKGLVLEREWIIEQYTIRQSALISKDTNDWTVISYEN